MPVRFGLPVRAHGGLHQIHDDPQAMRDVRGQGARRAHPGGVLVGALVVALAEVGQHQRVAGEDLRRAGTARPGPADDLAGQRPAGVEPAFHGRQQRLVVAEVPAEEPAAALLADPQPFGREFRRFAPLAAVEIIDAQVHQRDQVPPPRTALASPQDEPPQRLAHLSEAVRIHRGAAMLSITFGSTSWCTVRSAASSRGSAATPVRAGSANMSTVSASIGGGSGESRATAAWNVSHSSRRPPMKQTRARPTAR